MVLFVPILSLVALAGTLIYLAAAPGTRTVVRAFAIAGSMWYAAPILLRPLADMLDVGELVSAKVFAEFATLETASLATTLLIAGALLRRPRFSQLHLAASEDLVGVWPTLAVGCLATIAHRLAASLVYGPSYLEQNAYPLSVGPGTEGGILGVLAFGESLLTAWGIAMLVIPRTPKPSSTQKSVLWSWIVARSLADFLAGSRIALFTPLAVLLLAPRRRWYAKAILLIAGGVLIPTAIVLVPVMGELRQRGPIQLSSVVGAAKEQPSPGTETSRIFLGQVLAKFDSFSTGAVLVSASGLGQAGWTPYEGAALALLPRLLLPNKPSPGSGDGSPAGHPSRVVARILGYNSMAGNMGVSPGAITLWQLGWAGLVLLVAANVIHVVVVYTLLLSRSAAVNAIGLQLIAVPAFHTLFATPDVILMSLQRTAALVLTVTAIRRLANTPGHRHSGLRTRRTWGT